MAAAPSLAYRGPVAGERDTTKAQERRQIAGIAVPVSLEFMVVLVLNFVNQVIVGVLGATAIAAVGFANSITFILIVTFGALGLSVSILVARAFGGGRRTESSHTVTAALVIAGALALIGALVPILAPGWLLSGLGASPSVAAAGADFLRLSAVTMVPTILVAVLSGALRSSDLPRTPLVATLVTVPVNVVLAYALVTGWGPMPALGVPGAGWAALLSMLGRLVVVAVLAFGVHRAFDWSLPSGWAQWRAIAVPLVVLAVPLALTDLLWSTGIFLYNVVAQQLGDDALAALQIVTTIEGVFIVGSIGLMSATTALVGRAVGRGDAAAAAYWARRLSRAGVHTAFWFGLLMAASAAAVPVLFGNAGQTVQALAILGLLVNAAFQVVKVRNMILGAGVMPSGGDVRGVILGDGVSAFLVGLPLAVVLALLTPLGLLGLFIAKVVEELAKLGIFARRTRRIDWQVVVDRERASAAVTSVG